MTKKLIKSEKKDLILEEESLVKRTWNHLKIFLVKNFKEKNGI
jgi:hypothetical protein